MPKKMVVTSAYIGYNAAGVGGYSFYYPEDDSMTGMADFVPHEEVFKIAKEHGIKKIHLAGDWSALNKKGYGETVLLPIAQKLSRQLRR